MESRICSSCSFALPEEAVYCPNCAGQVRCKACKQLMEPHWRACISCGTLRGETGNSPIENASKHISPVLNTIEYQETEKSRSLRASFTDSVGNGLTETIGLMLANRIGERALRGHQTQPRNPKTPGTRHLHSGSIPPHTSEDGGLTIDAGIIDQPPSLGENPKESDSIKRVFRTDANKLVLVNKDLKEGAKIDFVRRLTCLSIYYYELHGRDRVQRSELTALLDDNSVNDSHAREWLADGKELVVYSDGIGLSEQGREFAREVLRQIIDPSFQAPSHKTRARRGQAVAEAKTKLEAISDKSRKGNSSSKSGRLGPGAMLDRLISEGYFNHRHTVRDIILHCGSRYSYHYKNSDFTAPLTRLLRAGKLNRELNSEGQYEYFA
jgi:RNA polymerase subunit RPABC4/transcription elongation factor Spt4